MREFHRVLGECEKPDRSGWDVQKVVEAARRPDSRLHDLFDLDDPLADHDRRFLLQYEDFLLYGAAVIDGQPGAAEVIARLRVQLHMLDQLIKRRKCGGVRSRA
jgi:hypothetical protein